MACSNANCSATPTETTGNGANTIMNLYNYGGKAARLLTIPELVKGCKGTINNNTAFGNNGSLTPCKFLFEGTKYADANKITYGPWLDTPNTSANTKVWEISSQTRRLTNNNSTMINFGARPVIEVPYSKILY